MWKLFNEPCFWRESSSIVAALIGDYFHTAHVSLLLAARRAGPPALLIGQCQVQWPRFSELYQRAEAIVSARELCRLLRFMQQHWFVTNRVLMAVDATAWRRFDCCEGEKWSDNNRASFFCLVQICSLFLFALQFFIFMASSYYEKRESKNWIRRKIIYKFWEKDEARVLSESISTSIVCQSYLSRFVSTTPSQIANARWRVDSRSPRKLNLVSRALTVLCQQRARVVLAPFFWQFEVVVCPP